MALLNKFSLHGGNFLSVGLCGKDAEIRLSSPSKTTSYLSPCNINQLRGEGESLLQKEINLRSSPSPYGGYQVWKSVPDMATGGIKFITEHYPDAQPPEDRTTVNFSLGRRSSRAFVLLLPGVCESVQHIVENEPTISLVYNVLRARWKDYTKSMVTHFPIAIHMNIFLYIIRILRQYVHTNFLISNFKKRCPGTALHLSELFDQILSV